MWTIWPVTLLIFYKNQEVRMETSLFLFLNQIYPKFLPHPTPNFSLKCISELALAFCIFHFVPRLLVFGIGLRLLMNFGPNVLIKLSLYKIKSLDVIASILVYALMFMFMFVLMLQLPHLSIQPVFCE